MPSANEQSGPSFLEAITPIPHATPFLGGKMSAFFTTELDA